MIVDFETFAARWTKKYPHATYESIKSMYETIIIQDKHHRDVIREEIVNGLTIHFDKERLMIDLQYKGKIISSTDVS